MVRLCLLTTVPTKNVDTLTGSTIQLVHLKQQYSSMFVHVDSAIKGVLLLLCNAPYNRAYDMVSNNRSVYLTFKFAAKHYSDVIMSAIELQITGVSIVWSTACSGANQRKHQSYASLDFVRGIHVVVTGGFPHNGPVTRKCFHLMASSWCCIYMYICVNEVCYPCLDNGLSSIRHQAII